MASFDLNLTRVFVLLYETRSVTKTAHDLHLSQPTVSYGLGKMRRHFGDQLFRPGRGGLTPTALADRLYEPLRDSLAAIDRAVAPAAPFEPATSQARFTIAMSDLGEASLLPLLIRPLRAAAPGVSLDVQPLNTHDSPEQLARGVIDGFIATPVMSAPQIRRIPLFGEGYRVMAAANHPRVRSDGDVEERLRSEQYVLADGPSGHIGPRLTLESLDLLDSVAVKVSIFSTLPYLVQDSELLAIVPEYAGFAFAANHRVRLFRLPLHLAPLDIALYARPEQARSPEQAWFIDFISTTLRDALPPLD